MAQITRALRAARHERPCARCGNPLATSREERLYCSAECYWQAKAYPPLPCKHCGADIPRIRSRKAVYCSQGCRKAGDLRLKLGSRTMDANGYILIRTERDWEYEHRVIMGARLGRPLARHESVHHRNGDKADNREDNLELWLSRSHHPGQRVSDLLSWARWIVAEYDDAPV